MINVNWLVDLQVILLVDFRYFIMDRSRWGVEVGISERALFLPVINCPSRISMSFPLKKNLLGWCVAFNKIQLQTIQSIGLPQTELLIDFLCNFIHPSCLVFSIGSLNNKNPQPARKANPAYPRRLKPAVSK